VGQAEPVQREAGKLEPGSARPQLLAQPVDVVIRIGLAVVEGHEQLDLRESRDELGQV
jgi:hypothetical protein